MNPELRLRLGWIAVAVLFCAAALLLYVDYARYIAGGAVKYGQAALGAAAPAVTFTTLTGKQQPLSTYGRAPLVVNFFATWCVPCKAELPLLQSRYERLRSSGLVVVGVDEQEEAAQVRAFVKSHGVTYPVMLDDRKAFDTYGGHAIPTSLFIDRRGVLQAVHIGEMSADILDADIQKIL